jgi:acyl-CoA synthetase (NDP forming)
VSDEKETIEKALSAVASEGRTALNLQESRSVMEKVGVPFNRSHMATSVEDAVAASSEVGFPLVMKIVSPQIIHKTEVGGVVVGVNSPEDVEKEYGAMVERALKAVPDAQIKGVMLEEMVSGTEFIVGTTEDVQFGPMIMFGVGGIFVEVYKDVAFRLIPINDRDALDMLGELKGKAILEGARGLPKADKGKLSEVLKGVSKLIEEHPSIAELDINPLMITERGPVAVDARIILKKK